jgi:hypothetical protein
MMTPTKPKGRIMMTLSNLPKVKDPKRAEFSIRDKKGRMYPDILLAFLSPEILTLSHMEARKIEKNGIFYHLSMDENVEEEIRFFGNSSVLVSYQMRTFGCYAHARILLLEKSHQVKES